MIRVQVKFKEFNITTIQSSSGIFVGTNHAIGWSASSKSNLGFGSSNGGGVTRNMNLVLDNDIVDSPVDNRRVVVSETSKPAGQQSLGNLIGFDDINIISMGTNSAVSVGENQQSSWISNDKANAGKGTSYGKEFAARNLNLVLDSDLIDAPIYDMDLSAYGEEYGKMS